MADFDYTAPAELFVVHGREGLRYRRFANAAAAIRYAMEKLPLAARGTIEIQVADERLGAKQIYALYESVNYSLPRASS